MREIGHIINIFDPHLTSSAKFHLTVLAQCLTIRYSKQKLSFLFYLLVLINNQNQHSDYVLCCLKCKNCIVDFYTFHKTEIILFTPS